MTFSLKQSGLQDIYQKVVDGVRISDAEALRLFESKDLNAIGTIADLVCQRKTHNRASYIINRYINYSNYCILSCQFCAFARKKRDADGFEQSVAEIVQQARDALAIGITELHIVGGLHPSLPFAYYLEMLRALRALDPRLQLKCFTAIEVLHLAWLAKKSVEQTLIELRAAGLDAITGGGAEIFRPEIRSAIAKGKESAEEYLEVHRTWHRMGCKSTCTMLYGHVESLADRVDHLRQLRALQDETHGFAGFVPLPYQPQNNQIPVSTPPTGFDALRTIAISRIYLDNFDHITAYWVGMGLKLAQIALSYGADDLHGTVLEEKIFHMAGASSPQLQTEAQMIKAIREAGRVPVQRSSFYEPIKVWDDAATPAASAPVKLEGTPLRMAREDASKPAPTSVATEKSPAPGLAAASALGPFRVGSVPYLNAVPLTRGLESEVLFAPPSQLAEKLGRGELDAALVSVTAVLMQDKYDILDGVAIASLGEVQSVLLGHRRPLTEAREIYCDPASLTSVQLLRVLLAERGLQPKFKKLESYGPPDEMPDFVLLIGDPALDFLMASPAHEIWDLGAAWFEMTKLPFVYAAWALRRGVENKELRRILLETKEFGLETLDSIVRERTEYTCEFRKDYLGWHIHFHLGTDEKKGLARFAELLRKHTPGPIYEPVFVG